MSSTPDGEFEGNAPQTTGQGTPGLPEPDEEMSAQRLSAILSTPGDSALIALLEAIRGNDPGTAAALHELLSDPDRVRAIDESGLLDEKSHPAVDQAISLTIDALGVSCAALNVITADGQTHASIAWSSGETSTQHARPLTNSLCVYPVVSGSTLVIDDIADHPMLSDHPTACSGEVASYLGIPVRDDADHVIGVFCAWDTEPHHWSSTDIALMSDLSILVREAVFGS